MVVKRNIAVCIVLSIVTCGIYGIYWFISLTDDVRTASGDTRLSGGLAFLLSLVTCGLYGIYWAYLMGKAMVQAKSNNGLPADDNSILYLLLQIFGFGIINYCLIQSDLNAIAEKNSNK